MCEIIEDRTPRIVERLPRIMEGVEDSQVDGSVTCRGSIGCDVTCDTSEPFQRRFRSPPRRRYDCEPSGAPSPPSHYLGLSSSWTGLRWRCLTSLCRLVQVRRPELGRRHADSATTSRHPFSSATPSLPPPLLFRHPSSIG